MKAEGNQNTDETPRAGYDETLRGDVEETTRDVSASPRRRRLRRLLSFVVVVAAALGFSLFMLLDSRAGSARHVAETRLPADFAVAAEPQGLDFSKFGHTNPQHARLPCLLCHRREDNSPRPKLPGHMPCSGCHAQQFADQSSPICTICHTDARSGALKSFPASLQTFAVRFDHATHTRGGAQPRQACATCHRPERRGVSLAIPSGFDAHTTCFRCHAPQAQSNGRDISSCGTCHRVGVYSRTSENAPAYRVNFNHAEHTSKGLSCSACHNVRAGAAQRRQVAAPEPLMHHAPAGALSCAGCHNDKRAFGTADFKNCTRCHEGTAWHF
jgi:c(7)-type cytochrome triheme protein